MKIVVLVFLFCYFAPGLLLARHGKGGSITYEYLGTGSTPGTSRYKLTVKHYIDCDSRNFIENNVYIGIYPTGSTTYAQSLNIPLTSITTLNKTSFSSCINPQPSVCFFVVSYITETDLQDNTSGYTVTEQECCRINGIINVQNSSSYGITNTNTIPGVINGITYRTNSSPVYAQKDTSAICYSSYFTIDFSATDEDGDSLSYSFCPALTGGNMQVRQPIAGAPPPYTALPYQSGYSYSAPLGSQVTINSKTGLISGIAPSITGQYVISVCVSEYRKGVFLGNTKKEVHVNVAACSLTAATLKSSYINCDNFSFSFQNESLSSGVDRYIWDFGVPDVSTDISTDPTPSFTYPDTGIYQLKLKVSTTGGCEDSATAPVKVYPGFKPGFSFSGRCYLIPFLFTDTSWTRYGTIDSWAWNFGDGTNSGASNPSHQYTSPGTYTASLTVNSSKGCSGTASTNVIAASTPLLELPFHDTLICSIDSLPLIARGSGNFSWTPANGNILYANTANPVVFPKDSITYVVTLEQEGCTSRDSIKVNVLDSITVHLPADTTICSTDSFILNPVSDALQYQWSPANSLNNAAVKHPLATPVANTTYTVTARLGKCSDETSTAVKLVPYPSVTGSGDTLICFGTTTFIQASIKGSSFSWTPANSLLYANTLAPLAGPQQTTYYIIMVHDTLGCPKPVYDTILVSVLSRVIANAGNDTTVVAGQPLQLQATGGYSYLWTPSTGLSNPSVSSPVATFDGSVDSIKYTVKVSIPEGCSAIDNINVRIFKTAPDILVPTAFTPNKDALNDVLTPIPLGISSIRFFNVYNRLGNLVFTTRKIGIGWDGSLNGVPQPSGTYVFMAEGIDYKGLLIQRKGTVVLIR